MQDDNPHVAYPKSYWIQRCLDYQRRYREVNERNVELRDRNEELERLLARTAVSAQNALETLEGEDE